MATAENHDWPEWIRELVSEAVEDGHGLFLAIPPDDLAKLHTLEDMRQYVEKHPTCAGMIRNLGTKKDGEPR